MSLPPMTARLVGGTSLPMNPTPRRRSHYITVAEARRFLASATVARVEVRSDG
jgi:hypothetical protein